MPLIKIETEINAAIDVCFDLSRSIDLHKISTAKTKEIAIEGVIKGLISKHEFVTWQAVHFGIKQRLTSKITAFERPIHFCDEQIKGPFKKIKHDHFFTIKNNSVLMTDCFLFESPFGILGRIFNKIILTNYLRDFLIRRNQIIKYYAESGKWKELI